MSEHTRRLLTRNTVDVTVHGDVPVTFAIARKKSNELFVFLRSIQARKHDENMVPASEVFKELDKKYGKTGAIIRGLRMRDGFTQKELAIKLDVHQVHISQIENGKRKVGKVLARRFANLFRTDYRLFL